MGSWDVLGRLSDLIPWQKGNLAALKVDLVGSLST